MQCFSVSLVCSKLFSTFDCFVTLFDLSPYMLLILSIISFAVLSLMLSI
jgi:hypothetical protein